MSSSSVFRIYIGAKNQKPDFNDVKEIINPKLKEFDFMLQFARDYTGDANQNGVFKPQWDTSTFNLEAIQDIKKFYPVPIKVVVSIGGRDSRFPFPNVSVKDQWVLNASNSIKKLMDDYFLDGIDINYGKILATPDDFSYCIGELINSLIQKFEKKIIVSISPTCGNELHYQDLYRYKNQKPLSGEPWIDWVNYQFYDLKDTIPTAEIFVEKYTKSTKDYCTDKILLGFSTDPNDFEKLKPEVFLDGIEKLIERPPKLPGMFTWDAAHSYEKKFANENAAQQKLVNKWK